MRAIGVFGGTFDPIHRGHLDTVRELRGRLGLERVLLVPAGDPPHRGTPVASARERMEMVRIAVAPYAGELEIDDRELHRRGRSYTVLTLEELREEHPDAGLVLILGLDAWLGLGSWHRAEEVRRLARIAVMLRPGFEVPAEAAGSCEVEFVPVAPSPVSGSDIRARIARGERIGEDMLPAGVWSFIRQQRLYGYRETTPFRDVDAGAC